MNNLTVRPAVMSDAADICAVCSEEMGYPCSIELVRQKLGGIDKSREEVFAADVDGQTVGYVHVEKYDVLYFETMANILGLAVRGDRQRLGIGRQLILAAEKWAAESGIRLMRVNSGEQRTGAHAFYKSLGYASEKKQMRFTKELLPFPEYPDKG